MESLKDIRNRINSITSTRQITNTMKMVSAAKFKKAQDRITNLRPYADKLNEILHNLNKSATIDDNTFTEIRDPQKILIVVITSNRGLCGGFNQAVINSTINVIENKYKEQHDNNNVELLILGKTAYNYLKTRKYRIVDENNDIYDHLTFDNVLPIAEELMKNFAKKKYDRIELIYNKFKNAATQLLTVEPFLPITVEEDEKENQEITESQEVFSDYIIEPSKVYILNELIPKSLKLHFFRTLLDSNAAEHGARMTAMQQATDNATEMLEELRLQYNKARQASITAEILDIVNGAEALKG